MNRLKRLRNEISDTDRRMEKLFAKRMKIVSRIADYKKSRHLPVYDESREKEMSDSIRRRHGDSGLFPYYLRFSRSLREISADYQSELTDGRTVTVKKGCAFRAGRYMDLDRKVLIVTDSGIPGAYVGAVSSQCRDPHIAVLPAGEGIKSFENLEKLLSVMLQSGFDRYDCVVSVGGGTVSDLAGFAASCYMRGIDFYSIPTTVLAMADASVGGKTGIDFEGAKNTVGAFHAAKKVLIDTSLLETLDERQFRSGLAECVKVGAALCPELFELFESSGPEESIDKIVKLAVSAKLRVTEEDPREHGTRRVLNFGHTIGHAVESAEGLGNLLHGECVSIGMIPMCEPAVRERVRMVLSSLSLPVSCDTGIEEIGKFLAGDKKKHGDRYNAVILEDIGKYRFESLSAEEILSRYEEAFK